MCSCALETEAALAMITPQYIHRVTRRAGSRCMASLRDSGLAIYAEPVEGFPPHHYAQRHPLPPGKGDVLFVGRRAPVCRGPAAITEVARWRPEVGFETREILAFRVPRSCWFPS